MEASDTGVVDFSPKLVIIVSHGRFGSLLESSRLVVDGLSGASRPVIGRFLSLTQRRAPQLLRRFHGAAYIGLFRHRGRSCLDETVPVFLTETANLNGKYVRKEPTSKNSFAFDVILTTKQR